MSSIAHQGKWDQSRLTLKAFLNLVRSMSPAELESIPLETLPRDIPNGIVNYAPLRSRSALEQLLFAATRSQLQQEIAIGARYGTDVIKALDLSKLSEDAATHSGFVSMVQELLVTYKEYKDDFMTEPRLLEKVFEIDRMLVEVKNHSVKFIESLGLLRDKIITINDDRDLFQTAIDRLAAQLEYLNTRLGIYFYIRLMVADLEMKKMRTRVDGLDQRAHAIQMEIARVAEQIKRNQKRTPMAKKSLFKRNKNTAIETEGATSDLRRKLRRLIEEKNRTEVFVSESKLTAWLDAIVDANLSHLSRGDIDQLSRTPRMNLYHLLQRYCTMQEDAAAQVAANPFLQTDPKQAIKFVLASEKFILAYFARKKDDLTKWLGSVAKTKIDGLDMLEKMLLKEMRENARLIGLN